MSLIRGWPRRTKHGEVNAVALDRPRAHEPEGSPGNFYLRGLGLVFAGPIQGGLENTLDDG